MLSTFIDCGIFYLVLNIIIMLAYFNNNRRKDSGVLGFLVMLLLGVPLVVFCVGLLIREEVRDNRHQAHRRRTTEEKVDAIVYNFSKKKRGKHDRRSAK